MKHKHKWKLEYVHAGTLGKGLLYSCLCGHCLEFHKKKPNLKKVREAYEEEIRRLT